MSHSKLVLGGIHNVKRTRLKSHLLICYVTFDIIKESKFEIAISLENVLHRKWWKYFPPYQMEPKVSKLFFLFPYFFYMRLCDDYMGNVALVWYSNTCHVAVSFLWCLDGSSRQKPKIQRRESGSWKVKLGLVRALWIRLVALSSNTCFNFVPQ